MSIKRTCPISNFTSDEDSTVMGLFVRGVLAFVAFYERRDDLGRSDLFGQCFKAWIAVKRLEQRVKANRVQVRLHLFERLFEPIDRITLVAEAKIDQRNGIRGHVTLGPGDFLQNVHGGG